MQTLEFETKITGGSIDIPEQYNNISDADVRVVLYMQTDIAAAANCVREEQAKGFGSLSHRANPDLWEQEESASERMAAVKYAAC